MCQQIVIRIVVDFVVVAVVVVKVVVVFDDAFWFEVNLYGASPVLFHFIYQVWIACCHLEYNRCCPARAVYSGRENERHICKSVSCHLLRTFRNITT